MSEKQALSLDLIFIQWVRLVINVIKKSPVEIPVRTWADTVFKLF